MSQVTELKAAIRECCLKLGQNLLVVCVAVLLGMSTARSEVYKCVDPATKKVTYGNFPCTEGTGGALSITDNAVMDGASAQREIANRKAHDLKGHDVIPAQTPDADQEGYIRYSNQATIIQTSKVQTYQRAAAYARAALESQNVSAVQDALARITRTDLSEKRAAPLILALKLCGQRLTSGGSCDLSDFPPDPPKAKICTAPPGSGIAICPP